MNTKWLLNLFFLLLFCFLAVSAAFAQPIPSIADPMGNYVNPIANPDSIPKWQNAMPVVANLGLRVDAITTPNQTIHFGHTTQDLIGAGRGLSTEVFGFGIGNGPITHPGATIVTHNDVPVTVTWINDFLPGYIYPIPVDSSIMTAWNMPGYLGHNYTDLGVPFVAHLHGGWNDAIYDGTPEQWFTHAYHTTPLNPLTHGPDCVTNVFVYNNLDHEAATLWYHDHTLGTTRLNAYMGAAGFYFVRDANEDSLIARQQIPSGAQEIEIAIQDKVFYPNGALAYPDVDLSTMGPLRADRVIHPEMFGNVNVVNGKVWPYLTVERKQYRFRILNACDSRFYHLTIPTGTAAGSLAFKVIGSDGGLLYRPAVVKDLLIGPGERYDVVVDFRNPALAGQNFIMLNDAGAPYGPNAEPLNFNPNNIGQVLQFRVSAAPAVDNVVVPNILQPVNPRNLVKNGPTRKLILGETVDEYGRTMPMLGTVAQGFLPYFAPATEVMLLNSTEEWDIYNTTGDNHPMHTHLFDYEVLNTQAFTCTQDPLTGVVTNIQLVGPPKAPKSYELGRKDTKVMNSGEVTRILVKPDKLGKYVWHCHILSHEEHDMMRPFEVVATLPKDALAASVPLNYSLSQNYPNPFNPTTTIKFTLPENSFVTLKIYDVLGREVATLINNQQAPMGNHEVQFDASKLSSGMYVYRLQAGSFSDTKKMLLMK